MSEKNPYIRVGVVYYKIIERPQIFGDKISTLENGQGKRLSKTTARNLFMIFLNMMVFAVSLII